MGRNKKKRVSSIYQIRNEITNKVYIGSSNHTKRRWNHHNDLLKRGKHSNKHLQNSYDKYGKGVFIFEILKEVEEVELLKEEQKYLDIYFLENRSMLYNISPIAGSPMSGLRHSEKTIERLREASSGANHWAWGKKQQEGHNAKISRANKKYSDEEEKEMYALYQKGVSYTGIKKLFGEKHTETIRRVVRRYGRFRGEYENRETKNTE